MSVAVARPVQRITVSNTATNYALHFIPEDGAIVARVTNGKPGRPLDVAILSTAEIHDLRDALTTLLGA